MSYEVDATEAGKSRSSKPRPRLLVAGRVLGVLAATLAVFTLAACTGGSATKAEHTSPAAAPSVSAPPTTTVVAAPAAATTKVPTDLVGKTMGDAKAELTKAGFTRVVVAGGSDITDSSKVAQVSNAGQSVSPGTKIVLTGQAPASSPSTSGGTSACMQDSSKCYVGGQHCETGSCVNAARGLTQDDVKHETNEWLARHPGYCAYGETGATAPCDSGSGGRHLTDSDPEFRDANGETKAEYCARIGYPLATCPAG